MKNTTKDLTINTLRGLAIFTMVAANAAPYSLAAPHPLWFRFYGTFAAPLFILLSGMMVVLSSQAKDRKFGYFLLRGVLLLLTGAIVDIVGDIFPFVTFDVLYLIGISLPLAFFFQRLGAKPRWVIIVAIFALTPLLQLWLGYTDVPTEYALNGMMKEVALNQTGVLNHLLIDGWFPLFPWLGFSLLGVNLALLRWRFEVARSFGENRVSLAALGLIFGGGMLWNLFPGRHLVRHGYSEMFYPPTLGYIITTIGLIVLLFSLVDRRPGLALFKPLQPLGEAALFMYLLHGAVIEYLTRELWPRQTMPAFALLYLCFISAMILIGYGLRFIKSKWRNQPFLVRFLLGG